MPRGTQWIWFLGVFAALFVVIGLVIAADTDDSSGDGSAQPVPTKRIVAIPTSLLGPKLALVSYTCTTDASIGYITCEGFVRNISTSAIENVTAVVVFTDPEGKPLSSDDALIAYNPLLPEQESPFKIVTRLNPAFTNARIEFKELLGGQIKTRDDSTH